MTCAECGAQSPDGAKFCFNCGARLETPRPPEGERRFVTVLFADVVDSTAMGEDVDPEDIAEIMNGAFAFFNASVARFGGTVARLMGDAILAIFGAPIAHEDDAERAVHAGLAILQSAARYAQQVKRQYGVDFRVRVGINSGLAVLAMVGDDVKMEYTAMGDTANLASRLQNLADPGTLLVSPETHNLVRQLFETKSLGRVQVKGKAEPVELFQVTGIRAQAGSVRGIEGLQSPLVGRDEEVARAREALAGRNDAGSVVIISGEAGLGKSRMVAELRSWARQIPKPPLWLEGRALSYGQTISYYPWRQIVRGALGLEDDASAASMRETLRERVPAEDVAPLARLLSAEDDLQVGELDELTGEHLVRRIHDAVGRLITAVPQGRSVVVLDDLHWADEPSLELLRSVAELTGSERLVVVAITRPERAARSVNTLDAIRVGNGARVTEIALQPLTDDASQQLLDNLLQIDDLPDRVRDLILARSDGNPFFIEEVIRWLIDSGHIVQEDGGWRATEEIREVAIPETLAGVLASRIDRLPAETKRVVQAAAVIGRTFQYPILEMVCEQDRIANPRPHVRELTAEELIREKNPLVEYIFKHALTQEAARDLLLLRRRREYHALVAKTLEQVYVERLDEFADMLYYHYREAEDWERAAVYARRAGRASMRVYAIRAAVDHFNDEFEALSKLESPPVDRLVDATTNWVEIGWKFLPYEKLVERLEYIEPLARQLGDTYRLSLVLSWLGNAHVSAGFPGRGVSALSEAFALSEGINDPRLTILPMFMMTSHMIDTNPRRAIPELQKLYDLTIQVGRADVGAHVLANIALAHARLGEFADAERLLRRALMVEVDVPVKKADVHAVASLVSLDMGEVDRSLTYARQAVDEATGAGGGECTVYAMYCVGRGELERTNLEQARVAFDSGLDKLENLRNEYLNYLNRGGLAMIETATRAEDAAAQLEVARAQALAFGDVYTDAQLSMSLAEAHLRLGELSKAEESLSHALDYYRENGMTPYLVRAVAFAVALYEKQGRHQDATAARAELQVLQSQYDKALMEREEALSAV